MPHSPHAPFQRPARLAFVIAAIFAFVMAALPHPPPIPGQPPDTILHMLTFTTLGVLGGYGFRGVTAASLFVGLTTLGLVIELIQAVPFLHRDSDPFDLLADIAATLAALLMTRGLIANRRRRFRD